MALAAAFVDAHISRWESFLQGTYRAAWPSRTFHHAPLENAVEILTRGHILSRNASNGVRKLDVAGQDVIGIRDEAHNYARMYFRPRTPTQFHIEGIRKESECRFGRTAHAPILIMFVLDARKVLQLPGVRFSNQNMQRLQTESGDSEEYFAAIPFEKVFHDGGIGGDYSIIGHRQAEVLAPSPLELGRCLQRICCRSEAERKTLLYLLGTSKWSNKVDVAKDITVFQREYAFVEEVSLSHEGVSFQLNPRRDRQQIAFSLVARDKNGNVRASFNNPNWNHASSKRWITNAELQDGTYTVHIEIENQLAFEAKLSLGAKLV